MSGQENLGQRAFEKACRNEGLTPEESQALAASHGVMIPPTVLIKTEEEISRTKERVKQVVGDVQPDIEDISKETQVEKKIAQIEEAFTTFEQTFMPLMEQSVQTPELRVALANPFHIINANRSNPLRNFERAKNKAQAHDLPVEALMLSLPNPRHFAYAIEPQALAEHGAMIGYSPLHRILAVHPNWDPQNTLDRFGVYHETVHMMHQAVHRSKNMESFVRFYAGERNRVVIDEEYDAYALELEAIDIQLEGELRRSVAVGKPPDPNRIMEMLHLREDQRIPLTMLLWFASRYFPHGKIHQYPKTYIELVDRTCLHDGFHLFRYGPDSQPVPYKSL